MVKNTHPGMSPTPAMEESTKQLLRQLATRFETESFMNGDPSWFMHQVRGRTNQEVMGFIAATLSYGSRKQFMPKISLILEASHGEPSDWILRGGYEEAFPSSEKSFYRLYSYARMRSYFEVLRELLCGYGSLEAFAREAVTTRSTADTDVVAVLKALTSYFQRHGLKGIVPLPVSSLCKRPCMWMRWMVRDHSPVDLGLWSHFVDKRNLLIPLDTHVVQMARNLKLIGNQSPTWKTVVSLSQSLSEVFPDDPARGDFALFGYDVMRPAAHNQHETA